MAIPFSDFHKNVTGFLLNITGTQTRDRPRFRASWWTLSVELNDKPMPNLQETK
jgi:hypothetical protein